VSSTTTLKPVLDLTDLAASCAWSRHALSACDRPCRGLGSKRTSSAAIAAHPCGEGPARQAPGGPGGAAADLAQLLGLEARRSSQPRSTAPWPAGVAPLSDKPGGVGLMRLGLLPSWPSGLGSGRLHSPRRWGFPLPPFASGLAPSGPQLNPARSAAMWRPRKARRQLAHSLRLPLMVSGGQQSRIMPSGCCVRKAWAGINTSSEGTLPRLRHRQQLHHRGG